MSLSYLLIWKCEEGKIRSLFTYDFQEIQKYAQNIPKEQHIVTIEIDGTDYEAYEYEDIILE